MKDFTDRIKAVIREELVGYRSVLEHIENEMAELERMPSRYSLTFLRTREKELIRTSNWLTGMRERLTSEEFKDLLEQLSLWLPETEREHAYSVDWPEEEKQELHRYYVPHSDKAEMKAIRQIEREVEALLATEKILSERLCSRLRDIQDKIELRLTENARMLKTEQKEKQRATEQARKREEAEWQQAKKNAAW